MSVALDLQIACEASYIPDDDEFRRWCELALGAQEASELTIRVVDSSEMQALNNQYRGKDKPTNVLSFPADIPEDIPLPLLGDLIICADVVNRESTEQNKSAQSHWAHMTIHGCLHLLGYDHIDDNEAEEMEQKEIELLGSIAINNPYI